MLGKTKPSHKTYLNQHDNNNTKYVGITQRLVFTFDVCELWFHQLVLV